ncbi:hypothetical protein SAOR_10525 [Salinisphaera orenii MK-B5]|uniref:Uncharacterized protein n=1 Tax=Salinisphaera orenii MK-B5 TaxID=856730 RepID=A0A423PLC8_9GAMM|nr:hypothetical protein SAOR_10525 [Salinisphaera orenii MK-B5]
MQVLQDQGSHKLLLLEYEALQELYFASAAVGDIPLEGGHCDRISTGTYIEQRKISAPGDDLYAV